MAAKLKNLYLLQAALFVLLFIGLTVLWLSFYSSATLPALSLLLVAIVGSGPFLQF